MCPFCTFVCKYWMQQMLCLDRVCPVFWVDRANYSGAPTNMNTADLHGDMYFDMRTRALKLECGIWKHHSFWSQLDCVNDEVATPSNELAVTQIVLGMCVLHNCKKRQTSIILTRARARMCVDSPHSYAQGYPLPLPAIYNRSHLHT